MKRAASLRSLAAVALAFALVPATAGATPFIPANDSVVLESLPEKADRTLAALRRMRADLAGNPRDPVRATAVARRSLDAARALGDPRFLGQAQAALAPWWTGDDVPESVLLLRATLKQSQHDFAGALADLDRLLLRDAANAQARLTRATVLTVVGRYADARSDCATLADRVAPIVAAGCDAVPASVSGAAEMAYSRLVAALAQPAGTPEIREWALTLAAEIAARRGDFDAAERLFRDALALDPGDPYLKGAYADFLLDCGRAREVVPLLRADVRNDGLLLRLALAEARLPDAHARYEEHRAELAARFDAARRRGDRTHRREEARFRLVIERDARAALELARANWAVQREPADLRILLEAARAANDADAANVATAWIAGNRLEDAALVAPARVR